jgi:hypothetical protein
MLLFEDAESLWKALETLSAKTIGVLGILPLNKFNNTILTIRSLRFMKMSFF